MLKELIKLIMLGALTVTVMNHLLKAMIQYRQGYLLI